MRWRSRSGMDADPQESKSPAEAGLFSY